MRQFGLLFGVCVAALCSACSDDKDDQNTNTLNPQGGTGGTATATAGSGGTGGAGGAGNGGGGNGEGAQPSGIAGSQQAPDNGGDDEPAGDAGVTPPTGDAGGGDGTMSFFVTSVGGPNGGNFGGLAGADAFCEQLATAASPALGAKTWHAYLSTSTEDARDRIGAGPWRNFAGVIVANDVDQLHAQAAGGALEQTWGLGNAAIALDETGAQVPLQPVLHDILTGSNLDGTASPNTCGDWLLQTGQAQNGHSNRAGGGANPSSWNSAHATGCAVSTANNQQGTVSQGGGRGSIYCFAAD